MRVLADENMHPLVVARLRSLGHVVEWIRESDPGQSDEAILAHADIREFVLITFDRDFGELIFKRGHPHPAGLVYSRMDRSNPVRIADHIAALVERNDLAGHMLVVARNGDVRVRAFPRGD